jgi:hypothetical protein
MLRVQYKAVILSGNIMFLGSMRRILATDLSAYLLTQKQQLSNLGADNVFAQVTPDKDHVKEYLENPPAGMCL